MRYGTHKYGTFLYGAETGLPVGAIRWGVIVDWDNDGKYTGENEAIYLTDLKVRRGRQFMLQGEGGFENVVPGKLNLTLDNSTRRYDPYNSSGPLFNLLLPGRRIQLIAAVDTFRYVLFTGRITDIKPVGFGAKSFVTISAEDGIAELQKFEPKLSILEAVNFQEILSEILASVDWEYGFSADGFADYVAYFSASENASSWQVITELANANLAFVFCDGNNKLIAIPRTRSDTAKYTWTQAQFEKEIQLSMPWDTARNVFRVVHTSFKETSIRRLFTLLEPLYLGAGKSTRIVAKYSLEADGEVLGKNVSVTVRGNKLPDESGTELNFSRIFVETPRFTEIFVFNNTSSDGYITQLTVDGTAIYLEQQYELTDENQSSINMYGKKRFSLETEYVQYSALGEEILRVTRLFFENSLVEIHLEALGLNLLGIELGDIVNFSISVYGMSGKFHIAQIEHQWSFSTGQTVRTRIKLERFPFLTFQPWKFPAQIGVNTRFST